jgi:protein TonB
MLLRPLALLASLLIHGALGYTMWRMLQENPLDLRNDLDNAISVTVAPQGTVTSALTGFGSEVGSIKAQDAVSTDGNVTPTIVSAISPAEHARDVVDEFKIRDTERVPQRDTPPLPVRDVAAPELLGDIVDKVGQTQTQNVAPLEEPSERNPTLAAPAEPLTDDIASAKSVDPEEVKTPEESPTQEPETVEVDEASSAVRIAQETPLTGATAAPALEPLKDQRLVDVNEPLRAVPPQENVVRTQEAMAVRRPVEPKLTTTDQLAGPNIIEDQGPRTAAIDVRPEQLAILSDRDASEGQQAKGAEGVESYVKKVHESLQRSKVDPHSRETGIVILRFTIGVNGRLLSKGIALSSGSPDLDAAALTTLISAAPFPAIPTEVSAKPMTFTQLFRFILPQAKNSSRK